MPRTKLGNKINAEKEALQEIPDVITLYLIKRHEKRETLAEKMWISYPTFVTRMRNPDKFSLGEIRRAIDYLKIAPEDQLRMLRYLKGEWK